MKILSLSEQNVKRLSAVEMTLDDKGSLVIVAGNNEQGKSSLLDGIEWALGGGGTLPQKPVRRGQEKATVEMTLGKIGLPELTVKRVITAAGGGSLVVTNKDGQKQSSPQAILDALVGKLTFDPLAFARLDPKPRSEITRQLMGLDFAKQDAERDALFKERTEVNRVVKAKEAALNSMPHHELAPAEEQSSAPILEAQDEAIKNNRENAMARAELEGTRNYVSQLSGNRSIARKRVEHAEAELKAATQALENLEATLLQQQKRLAEQDAAVAKLTDSNLQTYRQELAKLETTNAQVRDNKRREQTRQELKEATKRSETLTRRIDGIEDAKRDAIARAKFPVPGMTLGDTGEVLLDGLPFDQASTKGQLMASLAMGAALNPKLRVLLVRSGNDLDDASLKFLGEWAEQNEMQVWLERISTNGKVAVIIEDGHAV